MSESALTSRITAARRVVRDDGRAQRCIRTIHGRGYRFVAPVETTTRRPGPTIATERPRATPVDDESAALARDAESPIRYTQSDGLDIAYQITGSGTTDLVLVAGFVSP